MPARGCGAEAALCGVWFIRDLMPVAGNCPLWVKSGYKLINPSLVAIKILTIEVSDNYYRIAIALFLGDHYRSELFLPDQQHYATHHLNSDGKRSRGAGSGCLHVFITRTKNTTNSAPLQNILTFLFTVLCKCTLVCLLKHSRPQLKALYKSCRNMY